MNRGVAGINPDVQRRRQHGPAVAAGALADDAVEHSDDVFALPVGEVGDEPAWNGVAAARSLSR
jgi:hypothetical protein